MTTAMTSFRGASVIITGGAKGIGAATAQALQAAGADVTLFDVDSAAGESLCAAGGTPALHFAKVDITRATAVDAAVAQVLERNGKVDVLVNSAGVAPPLTLPNISPSEWQRVMAINLEGAFNCINAVQASMKARRSGAIVNISSVAGKNISMGAGLHYTTSKWGLIGLSRHLAYELAPFGIRVNIVCPGPTLTTLIELDDATKRASAASVPLGRWISPEDVANAVVFLAGPGAAMCTGAEIVVDGGALLGSGDAYGSYFERRGDKAPERDIQYPDE